MDYKIAINFINSYQKNLFPDIKILMDMQAIPEDVLDRFNEALKQRAVHESFHVYYKKGLRYFLDFCSQYSPLESKSEQVRLFIEKLKSKRQTPQQCIQAAHAVSLFFESQQPANCPPSSSAEGKNLPSARLNHPAKAGVAKSAVTGDIGLPAVPALAAAEPFLFLKGSSQN